MKQSGFPLLRALAVSSALVVSAYSMSAFAAETPRPGKGPCTIAQSKSSPSAGSQRSAAIRQTQRSQSTIDECRGAHCGLSSTVQSGPGGLAASTDMPGGSSVTVHSGSGGVSSSTVIGNSSVNDASAAHTRSNDSIPANRGSGTSAASASSAATGSDGASAAASAAGSDDCATPRSSRTKAQRSRQKNEQKP